MQKKQTSKPWLAGNAFAARERRKDGRLAGRVYPEIEASARQRCEDLGLSMGDYLSLLIERDLQDQRS